MAYRNTIVLLLGSLALVGCAPLQRGVNDLTQKMQLWGMGGYTKGEKMLTLPDKVWKEDKCGTRRLPYLVVERSEVAPKQISAGGKFKQRIVYSLCPRRPTEVVHGYLTRAIYYDGRRMFADTTRQELKPGRWRVDAVIDVPKQAGAGVYALKTEFRGGGVRFVRTASVVVEAQNQ